MTYETVRQWCLTFGQTYANELRRRRPRCGDKWHLDEVVHACIYACMHAQSLGIDHPFQDADIPTEPAVALIFGLKGGVEQLLACVILKKGAALQSK